MANNFMGIRTALWEKWVEFRAQWRKITVSALISPILYMIALGWGLGSMVNAGDRSYINFLIPGIIAMTTMTTGFSSVAMELNVQRLYERSFDQVIISPTPLPSYIFGQMLGGAMRGMYSGVLILLVSIPFGASINVNGSFFLAMFINGLAFAALGVLSAVLANTHSDVARFSTYVIAPMTFLCNTVFPIDKAPPAVRYVIEVLPLTHASRYLRAIAYGDRSDVLEIIILAIYAAIFIFLTNTVLIRRQNL